MTDAVKLLFLTFLTTLLIVLPTQNASACMCAPSKTIDKEFAGTPNVVLINVRSVELLPENTSKSGSVRRITLIVEKSYKGNLKAGKEFIYKQYGANMCSLTFIEENVGQNFLLYLGEGESLTAESAEDEEFVIFNNEIKDSKNAWPIISCSRSADVKSAAADLMYLDNLAKVRGKTRLSGNLTQYIAPATGDDELKYTRLADFKVKISGQGKNIILKTDENGVYEVYDLPAGKYKITPARIKGYAFSDEISSEVEIKPKSHTEKDFFYKISNRIGGKLFGSDGKPLSDVCLNLIPARSENGRFMIPAACTEADGIFKFEEIPAGVFLIVFNEDGVISAEKPFGTFYYPNAAKPEDATKITIGAGDFIDNLIFNAPYAAQGVAVSGILQYEDGKPAASETVRFLSYEELEKQKDEDSKIADATATTDEKGRLNEIF